MHIYYFIFKTLNDIRIEIFIWKELVLFVAKLYIIYFPTFQYLLIMLKIMMWSHLCKNSHLHRKKTLKHLENFTMVMLSLIYKIPGDFYFILFFYISKITIKPYINLKYLKICRWYSTSDKIPLKLDKMFKIFKKSINNKVYKTHRGWK